MKLCDAQHETYRTAGVPGDVNGAYTFFMNQEQINVIASDGFGWDHVSVSAFARMPTYEEMEYVRRVFFRKEECVMQLNVPRSEHINLHPYCLHWWRPQDQEIPRPPGWMVAPQKAKAAK